MALNYVLILTMALYIIKSMEKDPSLEFISLHSVDMSGSNEVITKEIMDQMTNLGFLLLSNIPNYDEEELFRNTQWFFA